MTALRSSLLAICLCAVIGLGPEVSLASERSALSQLSDQRVKIPKPPSGVQPFRCNPRSGVCQCMGKEECDYMKDVNPCEAAMSCAGEGDGYYCLCRAKGFTGPAQ